MPGMRSGSYASLSASDIAVIIDHELSGAYEPAAPRPPANGVVMPDAISIGDTVECDFAGAAIEAVLEALSPSGRATIRASMLGRDTRIDVDAADLRIAG